MNYEMVYLALGTNLGDRLENLRAAVQAMPAGVEVLRSSPIYETEPWGYTDQPRFLNQVIEAHTVLSPRELLVSLKDLELQLGRKESFRYGPRQIDLDILFYGEQVINEPQLQIPHPRLHERAFVLVPLAALAPTLRHPINEQTVSEMLLQVDTSGVQLHNQQPPTEEMR